MLKTNFNLNTIFFHFFDVIYDNILISKMLSYMRPKKLLLMLFLFHKQRLVNS